MSVANVVVIFLVFLLVGNLLHTRTGDFLDGFNVSSVVTCLLSLGLLAGLSFVESKKFGLSIWTVLIATLFLLGVGGAAIAFGVAVIAGGIG